MSEHNAPAILIVDDTPENLDLLTDLLKAYRVSVALDGPTALELADEHTFDLILLDIMMPGMDGFEVCTRLKSIPRTRDIPVIFITAVTDAQSLERAFGLGGVDYVTKPFRPTELLARVRTHLQLYAMRTRLESMVETAIAERQLQERLAQRQARLAVMGEMLDAVAHQWNQPLGAVTLANDLLSMQDAPVPAETVHAHCDTVRMQLEHMQETLYDFRSFLRPGDTVARTNTRELLSNVQTLMRGPLTNARVVIDTDGVAEDAALNVNASEFLHVLVNLVANAVDAFRMRNTDATRTITFIQETRDGKNLLIVEDNAGGIAQKLLPAVFEPDVSGKPEGEGSGIGLYMSRRIVEKHGGSIAVRNTPTGARFTITLP